MTIRFLPQKIHGILDYAVALTLIAIPFILNFRQDSEFAHWLSVAAGVGLFLYSLATDYSVGVVSAISIRQHLTLDFAAGALFVGLAAVANFSGEAAVFYGVIGAAVLAVVAVTELEPTPQPAVA
ncbi:MAG: SPW repeat domain-containing protein [Acidimicrobiales bacterium]